MPELSEIAFTCVGGINTACVSRCDLVELIVNCKKAENEVQPILIFDNNGQAISMANSDPQFMKLLCEADIIHADGESVVLSSLFTSGEKIPERSATTDLIHDIPRINTKDTRHFLLGGKDEIVKEAADILSSSYQNFIIAGIHHGYFGEEEEDALCELINESDADVLWVGLGKPKEQLFCIRNKERLRVPVIITCGGCYNYITGHYSRAPHWMQSLGLEWFYRMVTNPSLFPRYALTNPHAIYCTIKHLLSEKF